MDEIEQNALQETQSRSQQAAVDAIPDVTERRSRDVLRTILIVVGILLVVAAISAIFFGLVTHPNLTAVLADISIIVLALTTAITATRSPTCRLMAATLWAIESRSTVAHTGNSSSIPSCLPQSSLADKLFVYHLPGAPHCMFMTRLAFSHFFYLGPRIP